MLGWVMPNVAVGQQCPAEPTCNAVFGSLVLPTLTTKAANRIMHNEQLSPDGKFTDEFIGFSYNESWNPSTGLVRDDATQPLASMGLESYWNGRAEVNIDLSPANSSSFVRPLAFNGAYDGSVTQFRIGDNSYATGAGGVLLEGGNNLKGPLINLTDQSNSSAYNNMLQMSRQNGSTSVAWRAGGIPRLIFALQSNIDANAAGNFGVLKFGGEWDFGEPIFQFEAVGINALLATSYPVSTDIAPRFSIRADGLTNWGAGDAAPDTDLYRSTNNTLRTDGNLVIAGNLAVLGEKSALVPTASYGYRKVYAVESPEEWFEDFGSASLKGRHAEVQLDMAFAQTVNTDYAYHVFLTPNGRCSLYVTNKHTTSFKVQLLSGRNNCKFDYRVVARRRGYESVRLASVRSIK